MLRQRRVLSLVAFCLGIISVTWGGRLNFAQTKDSRLAVPSEEAQGKARQIVEQLFQEAFAKAKSSTEKVALFHKIVEEAEKAKDDPAGRFVLFEEARDLAVRSGELELAVEAVDQLAETYSVSALAMKEDMLRVAGRSTRDPGQFAMIADRAVGFIEEAVSEDDYERAGRLGKLATAAAQKAKDTKLVKAIVARLKEVRSQQAWFEEATKARAVLANDAKDAEANLTVGRYLCLIKGDWPGGLKLLALGSDKALQHLANKEAQKGLSAVDQIAVADGWWAIGKELEGRSRDQVFLHAGSWYRRAQAGLPDTLLKRRVEQRLAETAKIKPPALPRASLPKQLTNSIGMKLVLIRAGEFLMGSSPAEIDRYAREATPLVLDPQDPREESLRKDWYAPSTPQKEGPQHRVRITKPFYLGAYEVTQGEYEAIIKKNPSYFSKDRLGKDTSRYPVEFVSWDDAVEFCRLLSALPTEKEAGRVYRLPTEAEWEYACRAGSAGAYYFGDEKSRLGDYVWFAENAKIQAHPVGEKAPNAWGLYDMLGNVGEYCADAWNANQYAESDRDDPLSSAENGFRIRRGGTFWYPFQMCRCAYRHVMSGTGYDAGFRVVCVTSEIAQLRPVTPRRSTRGRD